MPETTQPTAPAVASAASLTMAMEGSVAVLSLGHPPYNLMDEALFNLWKSGLCEEQSVVAKSNGPGELRTKIQRAKQGLFDEESEEEEEDDDDHK